VLLKVVVGRQEVVPKTWFKGLQCAVKNLSWDTF
jgi:hypothetical protein